MRQVQLAFRRPTPVVLGTIVTLIALWVLSALTFRFAAFGPALYRALSLDPAAVVHDLRLWTPLTYVLVHDLTSPWHVLLNALLLYFFGPELEVRWGKARFLWFMVLTALAGAAFVLGAYLLGLSQAPVVGASAIALGLLVAWGILYRDRTIFFFFVIPMRAIHVVWLAVIFEVLGAISLGPVSAAAHFGGMAMGATLVLGLWRQNRLKLFWDQLLVKLRIRKAPKLYVVPKPGDRYNIH